MSNWIRRLKIDIISTVSFFWFGVSITSQHNIRYRKCMLPGQSTGKITIF